MDIVQNGRNQSKFFLCNSNHLFGAFKQMKWTKNGAILLNVNWHNQFYHTQISLCVVFFVQTQILSLSLVLAVHRNRVMCVHTFTFNGTEFTRDDKCTTHHFDIVWKILSNKLEKKKMQIWEIGPNWYNFVRCLQPANFTIFVIINQIMSEVKINKLELVIAIGVVVIVTVVVRHCWREIRLNVFTFLFC